MLPQPRDWHHRCTWGCGPQVRAYFALDGCMAWLWWSVGLKVQSRMDSLDVFYSDHFETSNSYETNPPACRYSQITEQETYSEPPYSSLDSHVRGDCVPFELPPCQHGLAFPGQTHSPNCLRVKDQRIDAYSVTNEPGHGAEETGGQVAFPWMRVARSQPCPSPTAGVYGSLNVITGRINRPNVWVISRTLH